MLRYFTSNKTIFFFNDSEAFAIFYDNVSKLDIKDHKIYFYFLFFFISVIPVAFVVIDDDFEASRRVSKIGMTTENTSVAPIAVPSI